MSHNSLDTITLSSNATPLPGNATYTYVIDSTRYANGGWSAGSAAAVPGTGRGELGGSRITGSITHNSADAITITFQLLTNPSGTTAAAFETDASGPGTAGVKSLAQNTTFTYSWLPPTPDWRIMIQAGAAAPTTLYSTTVVTPQRTSGA